MEEIWKKVGAANVLDLFFFLLCPQRVEGKKAAPSCQTTSAARDGGWSFGDAFKTSM